MEVDDHPKIETADEGPVDDTSIRFASQSGSPNNQENRTVKAAPLVYSSASVNASSPHEDLDDPLSPLPHVKINADVMNEVIRALHLNDADDKTKESLVKAVKKAMNLRIHEINELRHQEEEKFKQKENAHDQEMTELKQQEQVHKRKEQHAMQSQGKKIK